MPNSPDAKKQFAGVELLRVVAILGVIWFHAPDLPYKSIAFSGLVVFVLLAVTFVEGSARSSTFGKFLSKRSRRLAVPWIFWFLVYGMLNLFVGKSLLPRSTDPVSAILAGPWIGLWYLPFIMVACMGAYWVFRLGSGVSSNVMLFAGLIGGLVALTFAESIRQEGFGLRPWSQWVHAMPAIPFSFAISSLLRSPMKKWTVALVCITPLCFAVFTKFSDPGLWLTYVIAIPATTTALLTKLVLPKWMTSQGAYVMGVYVVHGALLAALGRVLPAGSSPYLLFGATAIGAFVASVALRQIPLVRETV